MTYDVVEDDVADAGAPAPEEAEGPDAPDPDGEADAEPEAVLASEPFCDAEVDEAVEELSDGPDSLDEPLAPDPSDVLGGRDVDDFDFLESVA
ncbi:MAG: hypothetical protein LBN10_12085 [Propionibacteriaceae bacterium]|nr:hypothetical protein [Propionibacteriaceae bacterium]